MVGICTNTPAYRNDIAEEIRLFLGLCDIELTEADDPNCDVVFSFALFRVGLNYTLAAHAAGADYETSFTVPDDAPLTVKKHEKRQLKLAAYALLKRLYPAVETPWGSLTGIRPTKLFRELAGQAHAAKAARTFCQVFDVTEDKTELARAIVAVQQPYVDSVRPKDIDIYIGIPFCKTRCLYCSFASEAAGNDALLERYLEALKTDIAFGAALVERGGYRVRATYVGGGTPTVLTARQLDDLLAFTKTAYGTFGRECTVEAGRPDTITREKLTVLRDHGVGRISVNPQSMHDETLARIGRAHTVQQTLDAFALARDVGGFCINMDLIAGLPGETAGHMARTCDAVAKLQPDNLTVHALAIKRSSRLKARMEEYPLPTPKEAERMIQIGRAAAEALGMRAYYMYRQKYMSGNLENVGYAVPEAECIYNIDMMEETVSILSHGAGSMSKRVFGGENRIERLPRPKDVPTYLNKLPQLMRETERFFSGGEPQPD